MLLLLDNFCDGKPNGDYRDPDTCHGFISCSNGIPYKMPCPAQLCFNERKDQCENCNNVPCGKPLIFIHHYRGQQFKIGDCGLVSPENKNIRRIVQFSSVFHLHFNIYHILTLHIVTQE